jgi:DNA-binding winged helix-turn-helix (wHTH) protein
MARNALALARTSERKGNRMGIETTYRDARHGRETAPAAPRDDADEETAVAYAFAGFTFDPASGLERGGSRIPLAPTEARLLAALLEAGGRVVTKDELAWRVWRGAASDNSISRAVCAVRRALRAGSDEMIVQTIYSSGFRIAVPLHRAYAPLRRPASAVSTQHPAAVAYLRAARELLRSGGPTDVEGAAVQLERAVQLLTGTGFAPGHAS